jgi:hypothetical protein
MRTNGENGQAIILVVVAVGLVLMGALGLAVDASQYYGQRQMAQAAADAAAEAGILSIFDGTWSPTCSGGSCTAFNCTNGSDSHTVCAYARMNDFGTSSSSDTVAVDFPTSVTGATLSSDFTPAAVHVLISRPVNNTFMRILGASASFTIKAAATAAIMKVSNPVPIVVLHPSMASAFSASGGGGSNPNIKICGGPQKSIQVNSTSATAVSVGGSQTIDLSKGGPSDTSGNCSTGTGTDFGVSGGPDPPSPTTLPSYMTPSGTTTHYYSHDPRIPDPLLSAGVNPPTSTILSALTNIVQSTLAQVTAGIGDCPASVAPKKCTVYLPGIYTGGIGVQGTTAIFQPGIYYVTGAPSSGTFKGVGFGTQATGSDMIMCSTTCVADTSGCCTTGNGMMVYMTGGGAFNVQSGSSSSLKGSDTSSAYKGVLFFGDRDNSSGSALTHSFGGGAALTLQGTIYLTNKSLHNQTIQLKGGSGSGTLIQGEIITDILTMGGSGSITMNLNAGLSYTINQVALVN